MTLYELLHNVSFDELIPTLKGVSAVRDVILKVVHSKD